MPDAPIPAQAKELTAIANGPEITQEVHDAVEALSAQAKIVDDLVPDQPS